MLGVLMRGGGADSMKGTPQRDEAQGKDITPRMRSRRAAGQQRFVHCRVKEQKTGLKGAGEPHLPISEGPPVMEAGMVVQQLDVPWLENCLEVDLWGLCELVEQVHGLEEARPREPVALHQKGPHGGQQPYLVVFPGEARDTLVALTQAEIVVGVVDTQPPLRGRRARPEIISAAPRRCRMKWYRW